MRMLTLVIVAAVVIACLFTLYPRYSWRPVARSVSSTTQSLYKNLKASSAKSLQPADKGKMKYYSTRIASAVTQRGVIIFFGGTAVFLFVVRLLVGFKAISFISTLEHELVHGIVAILSGGSLNEIKVTADKGGLAQVTKANFFVHIAPYCLPLFCVACFCLIPFLQHNVRTAGIIVAGLAYGSYLRGNFPNIGSQPDIKNSGGKLLAYPFIFCSNAALLIGMIVLLAKWDAK